MTTLIRTLCLVVLLACFGLVVYLTIHHQVGDFGLETDIYTFYAPTAQAMQQGRIQIDDFHPPLYAWMIGLLTMTGLFPGEFEASLVFSVLGYLVSVLFFFLIARRTFVEDERIAWLATAIVGCNPILLEHACRSDVHIVYLGMSMAAVYYALRKNAWMTGLLVALAIWTRYTWMLSIIPLFFLPWKKSWPGWLLAVASYVGLGLLTLHYKGGWYYSLNNVSVAAGFYNTTLPNNVGLWDQLHEAQFKDMGPLQILLYDPGQAILSVATKLAVFPYKTLVFLMVPPTGLLAIFGLRKKYWGRYRHPLLWWTAGFFAILVLTFWADQYILGLVPLLGLAAAAQLADLPRFRFMPWVAPLLIAGLAVWGGYRLVQAMNDGPMSIKVVAMAMRDMPGKVVVTRDPRVLYYGRKQPGSITLTAKGSVRVVADYIFLSPYEFTRNDTLLHIFNKSDFEQRCDNLTPWSGRYVKVLKMKDQFELSARPGAPPKTPR
jgi:hypothetical protein